MQELSDGEENLVFVRAGDVVVNPGQTSSTC